MFVLTLLFVSSSAQSQHLTSAKLYMQQSQYDKAEASALKAAEKDPQDAEAWYILGKARYELRKYPEMLEAFSKADALDPEEYKEELPNYRLKVWAVSHNEGVSNYNKGRDSSQYFQMAINSFKTGMTAMPDSTQTYYVCALAYYGNKQLDDAIKTLDESLARKPNQTNELELLGRLRSQKAREKADAKDEAGEKAEYEAAIVAFEKLWALDRTNTDNALTLIDTYNQVGMKDKSLAFVRDAVEKEPKNRSFRYIYAVFLMNENKTQEAIEQFQIVESQKDSVDVIHINTVYNLGVVNLNFGVAMKKEAEEKAEAAAKAKTKGFKEDHSYKEKFKAAAGYFEKSAELKPDDPLIWQQLGKLYANLNMPEKATKSFEMYDQITNGLDGLMLGMPGTQVESLWGSPQNKVTTVSEYGADEHWIYKNRPKLGSQVSLYFVQGKLKIWQTIK